MDAILYTKERIIVDSDYSPFMVGRALISEPRKSDEDPEIRGV